jgi:hypothetical protein
VRSCVLPILQLTSKTLRPLLILGFRAGALRHPAGDLLSDRHQVCGVPCGVLVTREIKEEGSLGLSDRMRERERVEIDPVFVSSSTGTRFFRTKPR